MPVHVAFLRAVNVGKRQLRMAELRDWLVEDGFTEVETYIQTGNVRVRCSQRSSTRVGDRLEGLLLERAGFEVPCMMFTPGELREAYEQAGALDLMPGIAARRYVTFLKAAPPAPAAAELDAWDAEGERVRVLGRTVHWWLDKSSHEAKLSNVRLERTLGPGTTRDLKVVATLAERWGA